MRRGSSTVLLQIRLVADACSHPMTCAWLFVSHSPLSLCWASSGVLFLRFWNLFSCQYSFVDTKDEPGIRSIVVCCGLRRLQNKAIRMIIFNTRNYTDKCTKNRMVNSTFHLADVYCPYCAGLREEDPDCVFPERYPVSSLLGCVDVIDCIPQEIFRQTVGIFLCECREVDNDVFAVSGV